MTTRVDNLEKRKEKFGSAREITEGAKRWIC